MCNVDNCSNKPWKNGYCYTKHRKLANSAPVVIETPVVEPVEPVSAQVTAVEEDTQDELFVDKDIVMADEIIMAPNQIVESALPPSVYTSTDISQKQINDGLFERIFDMETGGPCLSNLKSLSKDPFHEKFDHNKLAFILNNLEAIKEQYRPNARDSLSLDKYYERSKAGNTGLGSLKVKYFQYGPNTIRGRYQALDSLSGQNMVREARHTIFDDYYVDIDMDNCHPVITVWLCNKLSIPCEVMAEYVTNREKHIQDIRDVNPEQTRDTVKQLFLSINYGGSSNYDDVKNKTPFLVSYMEESAAIKKAICSHFPYFKAEADKITWGKIARGEKSKDFPNFEGSAVSQVCCFVENQLLILIVDYLKKKLGDISGSILCFDGIMIRKELYDESFLRDIEKIFADLGVPIKMFRKPLKPLDLTQFGYDPSVSYTFGDSLNDEISLDEFNDYVIDEVALATKLEEAKANVKEAIICGEILNMLNLLRKELLRTDEKVSSYDIFSRDVFTLREIALLIKKVFAYIYNDGEYYIMVKSTATIRYKDGDVEIICYLNRGGASSTAFKQDSFNVRIGNSLYNINLKKCLIACSNGIKYRNADVVPYSPLDAESPSDTTFNLFGKYQQERMQLPLVPPPLLLLYV